MKIPVLLLANGARVENDLLNVVGGGWENYSCRAFPWGISGTVCGIVELDASERGVPHVLSFSVRDQDGQELGFSASITATATRGDGPIRTPFAVEFSFVVTEPLLAEFVVSSDDAELASFSLPVRGFPSNVE